jgi:hypothetical protein
MAALQNVHAASSFPGQVHSGRWEIDDVVYCCLTVLRDSKLCPESVDDLELLCQALHKLLEASGDQGP